MTRLTLQPRRWYAMDYYFPSSGRRHASPIWLEEVIPQRAGVGALLIRFWHANYSEGVQSKGYLLSVLRRETGLLLALVDSDQASAVVIFTEITQDWLRANFGDSAPKNACALQQWCDEKFGQRRTRY